VRGFCFAVDTAGIHKGAAPLEQPLMLQIQYSLLPSYAYRYTPEQYHGPLVLDPYVNRLIFVRPLCVADCFAIRFAQRPESGRGDGGQHRQRNERMVQRRCQRHAVGLRQVAQEPARDQRPAARPKLIDSCCMELAMVLAMLESGPSTSA
jgi:hypothetical protein